MKRLPLDMYDYMPSEQKAYLRANGWHFNKKACEYAVSKMKDENGRIEMLTKEQVDDMLSRFGIKVKNMVGYDHVYVANMCKADFYKKSVPDEMHMAMYVRDVMDDVDAADGNVMRRWYASMVGDGMPVEWEEIL